MAEVIRLKETAVVRIANVTHSGKKCAIQPFERLLLSAHLKLISRSIGQSYLMGFKENWNFRNLFFSLIEGLTAEKPF